MPASTKISRNASWADHGVADAGLRTTVLPQMSAAAAFQTGIATGKFHGGDQRHDAERHAAGIDHVAGQLRRDHLTVHAAAFASGKLETVGGAMNLAPSVGKRLAFFHRQGAGQLGFATAQKISGSPQDLAALGSRQGSPRWQGRSGCRYRLLDFLGTRRGRTSPSSSPVAGLWVRVLRPEEAACQVPPMKLTNWIVRHRTLRREGA